MDGRASFSESIQAAFKNQWNLLFFGAAIVAAVVSGRFDAMLPIVVAAEVGYLGLLASNDRYRALVHRRKGKERNAAAAQVMRQRFEQLYRGLDISYGQHFDDLRNRCLVLAELATRDASSNAGPGVGALAQTQLASVNKLLWVYLKLLHTKSTLEAFLHRVDVQEIDRIEEDARRRFRELPQGPDSSAIAEKMRKSIEDTLATVEARRDNLKRAQDNREYVSLELQRIEAKLSGIAELAVNRQDPGLLTDDIDSVARSVEATEEAIGELQSLTGFTEEDDAMAPEILAGPVVRMRG